MQIDKDKTYQTRNGREVRIYEVHSEGDYPVHGAFKTADGLWQATCWPSTGVYVSGRPLDYDLVLVPKRHTREVWINMYSNGRVSSHLSAEYACSTRLPNCIACKHLTFDFIEGEGL